MKKIIACALLMAGSLAAAKAEGIQFFKGNWEDVKREAMRQGRPIFVDFYATWCGPCANMTRNVFPDDNVGAFFNSHLVSYRVDAEHEEQDLVNQMNLEAYPTLAFFDPSGNLIKANVGFLDTDELLTLAQRIAFYGTNKKKVADQQASREELMQFLSVAKDQDPDMFNKYAPDLVKTFTFDDLAGDLEWEMFTATTTDLKSPSFQMAVDSAQTLSDEHSDYTDFVGGVLDQYKQDVAANGTLDDMAAYDNAMKRLFESFTGDTYADEYFQLMGAYQYYLAKEDYQNYGDNLTSFVEKYCWNDDGKLSGYAMDLCQYSDVPAHQQTATAWAERSVSLNPSLNNIYNEAIVYYYVGDSEKALQAARRLYTFKLNADDKKVVDNLIDELKNG